MASTTKGSTRSAKSGKRAKRVYTTTQFQARQGDVLIVSVNHIPTGVAERKRDAGRVILAYGEVTGHAHAIDDTVAEPKAAIFEDPDATDGSLFLRVASATGLVHEEHARVDLPAGEYRVIRQREYSPEEIRNVAD
jgi:hypothetical protein